MLKTAKRQKRLFRDGIQERFENWIALNPRIYELFRRFAIQAKQRRKHYSADAILHRIRWEMNIEVYGDEEFKVNDHYSSRLARKLIEEMPEFAGFFELRVLKSE